MSVSYAGVSLPTVTPGAAAWVDYALNTRNIDLFQVRHDRSQTQSRLSIPNKEVSYKPKLGSLLWPTGANLWATGLYIATSTQLDSIKDVVYAGGNYVAATLDISDETGLTNRSISTSMWLLPSYPVVQITGDEQLYLLTLVDDRYWWWWTVASLAVTSGSTTFASLFTQALSSITGDTADSDYHTPGVANAGSNEYIALLLDSIAYNCGQRIVRLLDGTVKHIKASTAATTTTGNLALANLIQINGGSIDATELLGYLPTHVDIVFPNLDTGASTTQSVATSGLSPSHKTLKSTGLTALDAVWTPSASFLAAYAAQFADDWMTWQQTAVEATYAGIINWTPSGNELIEWTYREGMVSTRISRGPLQDLTEDLLHAGGGLVIQDGSGNLLYNASSLILVGGTVSGGSGHGTITFSGGTSPWVTQTVTSNPTITFSGGGSLTFNGPINTCSASTFTFNGGVFSTNGFTVTGGLILPQSAPTLNSGSTNNWNPSSTNTIYDLNPSGDSTITGQVAGVDGQVQWLNNVSGYNVTLTSSDTASTSGNQYTAPGGSPYIITTGTAVPVKYDTSTNKWIVLAQPSGNSSLTTYTASTGATYTLTNSFTNVTSMSKVIPAGNYEIWASGMWDYTPSAGGDALQIQLFDGSAAIGNTGGTVAAIQDFTSLGGNFQGTYSLMSAYTASGSTTITMQGKYVGSPGTPLISKGNLFIMKLP